jgi:hypothetical protein
MWAAILEEGKGWGMGVPEPKPRAGGGGVHRMCTQPPEEHSVQNSSCPPPSPSQFSLLLPQGRPGIQAGFGPKRPCDITCTAMVMNCEVTQCYLSRGEGAGSWEPVRGRGLEWPQTQDPGKVIPDSLVPKIEP